MRQCAPWLAATWTPHKEPSNSPAANDPPGLFILRRILRIVMQLSFVMVALLGLGSYSFAAPVAAARDTSLLHRGQVQRRTEYLEAPTSYDRRLRCLSMQIPQCFRREVQNDLRLTVSDVSQDFSEWKRDFTQDIKLWREQLAIEIFGFEEKYATFKTAVKHAIYDSVGGKDILPEEELRFHLAHFSEGLATLRDDIRNEISRSLVELSIALHEGCDAIYTPYPPGCEPVLMQLETLEKYYRFKIDIAKYDTELIRIHSLILEHAGPESQESLLDFELGSPEETDDEVEMGKECTEGDIANFTNKLAEIEETLSDCTKGLEISGSDEVGIADSLKPMGRVQQQRPNCAAADIVNKDVLADLHNSISECKNRTNVSRVETYGSRQGHD